MPMPDWIARWLQQEDEALEGASAEEEVCDPPTEVRRVLDACAAHVGLPPMEAVVLPSWRMQPQPWRDLATLVMRVRCARTYWQHVGAARAWMLCCAAEVWAAILRETNGLSARWFAQVPVLASVPVHVVDWLPPHAWALHWSPDAVPEHFPGVHLPGQPWLHRLPPMCVPLLGAPLPETVSCCVTPHGAAICRCGRYVLQGR